MALDARAQRALLGRTLREKWRLDALLGAGGMATVYAATHRNGSRGAIKLLHPEFAFETEIRTRLVREGYLVNRIKHRGIVRVIDDDVTEEGWPYLVMELLEGQTLKERWVAMDRRLPLDEALRIAEAVLDTLAAAHAEQVVHRDVKPDNVFLTEDGAVRLLDFGIARFREAAMEATQTGAMLGTPAFMAPEQALAHWDKVDARSDVFAVGATLWTVLTGRMVHHATTVPEALVAAATRKARPLTAVMPGAPAALAAVLDRALAFAPDDRYQSAVEMRDAIAALRASELSLDAPDEVPAPVPSTGTVALETLPGPTPPPAPARRRALGLASMLAVGVLGAGGAIYAFALRPPAPITPARTVVEDTAAPADTGVDAPPAPPSSAPVDAEAPPPSSAPVVTARPSGGMRAGPPPSASVTAPFDEPTALGAIQAEAARAAGRCGGHERKNSLTIVVTFTPDGQARSVRPKSALGRDTPEKAWCVITAMELPRIKVAPFAGIVSREITTAILVQ